MIAEPVRVEKPYFDQKCRDELQRIFTEIRTLCTNTI